MIDNGNHPDDPVEDQPKRRAVQSDVAERVSSGMLLNRFRHVAGIGWHEFTGGRWRHDPGRADHVREATRAYIRQRVDELRMNARDTEAEAWKGCLRRQEIDDIVTLMRGMHGISTDSNDLDTHDDLVNCPNGLLDLRTGHLARHTPSMLITKQAGAAYDASAHSDTWDEVLEAVPVDAREWLQVRFGQALSGYTEDSLVLTVGGGQNGKSAFMKAIMRAFGDYGDMISHRILLTGNSSQHPTELMDLRGLRLAVLEETPEEGNLDTHQLKTIIGTPKITARKMRQDSITFRTTHSLFINTNHYPLVATTDHGTWRRLRAVLFPYRFVDGEPERPGDRKGDPSIKTRIDTDPTLPMAALAWVVKGALRWYENPNTLHNVPTVVREASDAWRADSDVGFQFAQEFLTAQGNALVPVTYMAERFNAFLEAQGKRKWSNQTIKSRLPSSIQAAINANAHTINGRMKNTHVIGIADAFDRAQAERDWKPGKVVRAWEGVAFKEPE